VLALDPEVELRGNLRALADAERWLDVSVRRDPCEALLIGSLSYDLVRHFTPLPSRAREEIAVPEVCLAGFRAVYRYDSATRTAEIVGSDAAALARLSERVEAAIASAPRPFARVGVPARARWSDAGFRDGVRAVLRWIEAGDVYQVNLSRRLDLDGVARATLPTLYAALAERSPAPFGAYLDARDFTLLSNSPERFLRVLGRGVETCPIKGTRPRGATPAEDRWLARELVSAAKDAAEHLMIVDLERNDLGRVSEIGSVRVSRLAALRSYPTVHHLVSSVEAKLVQGVGWAELFAATFPSGSVTGAPKRRALEIVEALEPVRRGAYTGALGSFDAAGGIDLALAIRTAIAARDRLHLHLGGGIVAESDAEAELRETRDKGRAFAELLGARL
jgi:para-aminobenzoate synthetase component 1